MDGCPAPARRGGFHFQHLLVLQRRSAKAAQIILVNLGDALVGVVFAGINLDVLAKGIDRINIRPIRPDGLGFLVHVGLLRLLAFGYIIPTDTFADQVAKIARH